MKSEWTVGAALGIAIKQEGALPTRGGTALGNLGCATESPARR